MTKVALIESHTVVREALAIVLGANGYTLVNHDDEHDMLIADAIPAMTGRTAKVVVYAATHAIEAAVLALDAGVRGYILKSDTVPELLHGLKEVIAGETYISHGFANKVVMALRDTAKIKAAAEVIKLSAREQQLVKLLFKGASNKEIGRNLGLSESTVKHYMTVLMQKMSARSRVEVILAAQKLNGHDKAAL